MWYLPLAKANGNLKLTQLLKFFVINLFPLDEAKGISDYYLFQFLLAKANRLSV